MFNLWFGAAWIVMGLIWLRRAYTGEKAGVITMLGRPGDLVVNKRTRAVALGLGSASIALGIANIWVGLRRKG